MKARHLIESASKVLHGAYAKKLVRHYWDGRTSSYDELPETAQKALDAYMYEGWETDEWKSQYRWGTFAVPVNAMIEFVMEAPDHREAGAPATWEAYHQWYLTSGGNHKGHGAFKRVREVWPVILGQSPGEALQDGWHRLHLYVKHGLAEIPALIFIRPESSSKGSRSAARVER